MAADTRACAGATCWRARRATGRPARSTARRSSRRRAPSARAGPDWSPPSRACAVVLGHEPADDLKGVLAIAHPSLTVVALSGVLDQLLRSLRIVVQPSNPRAGSAGSSGSNHAKRSASTYCSTARVRDMRVGWRMVMNSYILLERTRARKASPSWPRLPCRPSECGDELVERDPVALDHVS